MSNSRNTRLSVLRGAAAGIAATAAMTSVARGWVKVRFPETQLHYHPLTNLQWLVQKLGRSEPLPEHAAMPLASALHYGYGALVGAAYATGAHASRRRTGLLGGWVYGLGLWAVSFAGYVPLLGIYKPAWQFDDQELQVTLLAHSVYGTSLAAILEILESCARDDDRRET